MVLKTPKTKFRHSKNRKNKINLVFDEEKRKEFLTGFHKRKLQRKKKAQEKFEQQLKDERKRLKADAKESYKKLVTSYKPIPELEDLLADEYEDDNVTVKIVELSTSEIAKQNNWIGPNQPKYELEEEPEVTNDASDAVHVIPGMELQRPSKVQKGLKTTELRTEKDVKKFLKKEATKNVQKSKAFQRKNKLERQKQKKKSLQQKKMKLKFQNSGNKKYGRK